MPEFPKSPYVLLEDSKSSNRPDAGLLFQNPIEVLECVSLEGVLATLVEIETFLTKGNFLAGWLSYECALPFHPTLKRKKTVLSNEPLIWMGVFKKPEVLSASSLENLFTESEGQNNTWGFSKSADPNETSKEFESIFSKIQDYISKGDVYQINHTFRLGLKSTGAAKALYGNLRRAQPTPFSALIETGEWRVLSLSPELFITRRNGRLISRPMKGTAKPGKTLEENQRRMEVLERDEKNRAENLMIADLIRNDFSRICKPGTVKVNKLFEVESFASVLQMSSEVTGELREETSFRDIYKALFPCGSITGAPKVRAMEIIHETEKGPRGIYTGAIGFLAPDGDFSFNVPIRTAVMDAKGKGWLGIGSGIVADSTVKMEYRECLLKSRFLYNTPANFALVETMLWSKEKGFSYLEDHLERLVQSAAYFNFVCPIDKIRDSLRNLAGTIIISAGHKVRLVLDRRGHYILTHETLLKTNKIQPLIIHLSKNKVSSNDTFLFHKTTYRPIYNEAITKNAGAEKIYDVIFQNEKDEITEGTFNNIFIEKNDPKLLTPPVSAGLLPGIYRAKLLESGRAKETSLTFEDLVNAKNIYLANSVRGLVKTTLCN